MQHWTVCQHAVKCVAHSNAPVADTVVETVADRDSVTDGVTVPDNDADTDSDAEGDRVIDDENDTEGVTDVETVAAGGMRRPGG